MSLFRYPVLRTERLVLRLPSSGHASAMAGFVAENLSFLAPWSPRFPDDVATVEYWEHCLRRNRRDFLAGTTACFVLFPRGRRGAPPLGFCDFTRIVHGPSCSCSLGYGLAEAVQGRGYMAEGLRAAISYMFDEVGMHRIVASYMPANERSGALLRRLGFVVEGCARDYLFIDGAWRDHVVVSLLNPRG